MVGKSVILVALTLTLTGVGALAADPPAPSGDERLICRGTAKSLGSRIRTPRRCRTAEQWQEEDHSKSRLPVSAQITEGQNSGQAARPQR